MIIYAESNFILELVLGQEEADSAEQILNLAETKKIELVLPSFSLMEPFWTIRSRGKQRRTIQQSLNQELAQLQRSVYNQELVPLLQPLTRTIVEVEKQEMDMLEKTLSRLLKACTLIHITADIHIQSVHYQNDYGLSPQDAIIYSSILTHMTQQPSEHVKLFLSRNWKDFDQEEIIEELQLHGCKYFSKFGHDWVT